MNLLNKIGEGYESLWKLIIRPERNFYAISDLGPQIFMLGNKKVKRFDVELTNPRGLTFSGSHFIPMDSENYPCVIYMHGNSSNRMEGTEYLPQLINQGISLMTFDFSGCGNAQGQYISLGWYQWQDLAQVVAYLLKKPQVTNLGLWGRSMGAVTALMYLKFDKTIKAAVFDSPFMSLKTLIQDLCRRNSSMPMFVFSAAMMIISRTIKNKASFDIYKLNPIEQAALIQTPGFFIGAVDDQLVSTTHIRQLFKAYNGKKHLEIVQGDHNANRPQRCIDQAIKFLKLQLIGHQSRQKRKQQYIPLVQQQLQTMKSDQNSFQAQKHQISNQKQIPQVQKTNKLSFDNIINGLNSFTFVNSNAPSASLKPNASFSEIPKFEKQRKTVVQKKKQTNKQQEQQQLEEMVDKPLLEENIQQQKRIEEIGQ